MKPDFYPVFLCHTIFTDHSQSINHTDFVINHTPHSEHFFLILY